jgi:hypothetical protein
MNFQTDFAILDGAGDRYRCVGMDCKFLMQPVDHPERQPVWISHGELQGLMNVQRELRDTEQEPKR